MSRLRALLSSSPVLIAALLSFCVASASAQGDVDHGKTLYNTWCAGCHGADPRQSQPHLAANNPKVLQDAMELVSQMNFLKTVLSPVDVADVTSYIGSVANTGVPVLNPTPASVDFSYQTVGEPSAPMTLLLTNLGSVVLNISAVTVSPADFSVTGTCIGKRNPSSTCALSVVLVAGAAGSLAGQVSVTFAESSVPLLVPVLGAGKLPDNTPLPIVVEYYNPELDNYFITADANEQVFVDSGAVGRWLRTGNEFRSGGETQVCRFYGNEAVNAANGRVYGPNSHFYTAAQSECDGLKAAYTATAPSWKFESLDFSTTRLGGSACATGT
ncbi:MAG: choice-of-anchor D domain-containing protein, partial [Betaproteobacteria bacterium]